jgi:hypothetical protein
MQFDADTTTLLASCAMGRLALLAIEPAMAAMLQRRRRTDLVAPVGGEAP